MVLNVYEMIVLAKLSEKGCGFLFLFHKILYECIIYFF